MWPSISIAFPCWNRGLLLEKTLASIWKQEYRHWNNLELVVVEDGDDGYTSKVAEAFGAKYVRRERKESYPLFQSIAEHWNHCFRECSNTIIILQCAEILHESDTVIADLVTRVMAGTKILAHAYLKDLNQDGSFNDWYNHPTDGSRPGWVSGSGPHCFYRHEMLEFCDGGPGPFDESMYGYGSEDDLAFYMLRKNGWRLEYVNTICAHQDHPRVKYEPVAGYANRALIRIYYIEMERGFRPPIPNKYPLLVDTSIRSEVIADWATLVQNRYQMSTTFDYWADLWRGGDRNPDDLFVIQRAVANEGLGKPSQVGEMIMEAAWAVIRADEALTAHAVAEYQQFPHWAARCKRCWEIQLTWAARALSEAARLMGEAD